MTMARHALESVQALVPGRQTLVEEFTASFAAELMKMAPDPASDGAEIRRLQQSIDASAPIMESFALLADAAAAGHDARTIHSLFNGLARIADRYALPKRNFGSRGVHQFDFFRFVGHEAMVVITAVTVRMHRWELLASLLRSKLELRNDHRGRSAAVGFDYLGVGSVLLANAGVAGQKRRSEQAELLRSRYGASTRLGAIVPFEDFVAADYLLFLRTVISSESPGHARRWFAPTAIFLTGAPAYLVEARDTGFDAVLADVLGAHGPKHLREIVCSRAKLLRDFFPNEDVNPLAGFAMPVAQRSPF